METIVEKTEKRNLRIAIFFTVTITVIAFATFLCIFSVRNIFFTVDPVNRTEIDLEEYNGHTITGSAVVDFLAMDLKNYDNAVVVNNGTVKAIYTKASTREEIQKVKDTASDRYISPSKQYKIFISHTESGEISEISFVCEE